jgi:hypothetical protein
MMNRGRNTEWKIFGKERGKRIAEEGEKEGGR